jgi:hypothetical protein
MEQIRLSSIEPFKAHSFFIRFAPGLTRFERLLGSDAGLGDT